jgi:hypothetical protein
MVGSGVPSRTYSVVSRRLELTAVIISTIRSTTWLADCICGSAADRIQSRVISNQDGDNN